LGHSSKEADVLKTSIFSPYRKEENSALTVVKINCGKMEYDGHNPNDLYIAAHRRT